MLIRTGFDITFETDHEVPLLALLNVHPDRQQDLRTPEVLRTEPCVPVEQFRDFYGNLCSRLVVPRGGITLSSDFVIEDSGKPDSVVEEAIQHAIADLPETALHFLMSSRYCEVSKLGNEGWDIVSGCETGWERVQAIVDAVHERIEFDYQKASCERTARKAFDERFGVCRDFAHLAIALCRAVNIPARYCTGYLGDIGIEPIDAPMDFSAWFEAYIGGSWYSFDARHNTPRIARIVMARGRDATDTAITTTFGVARLTRFEVHTDEVASCELALPPSETALPQP